MIIGRDCEFIQRELFMWFSDESRFTRDLYEVTPVDDRKTKYKVTVHDTFQRFASHLTPDIVFQNIDQITDDVKEMITGTSFQYHNWDDLLFIKDMTFDVAHFEDPKPVIIFKCDEPVGSLGKVLLCFSKVDDEWILTLRNTAGIIYEKTRADINELNNAMVSYRSLSLAAMPKAYFDENKNQWVAHQQNVDAIEDLDEKVDNAVEHLQDEFDQHVDDVDEYIRKTNEMYQRTVGDDSLLSQTYRKALRNQLDIYDLDRELHGYEEGGETVEGTLPNHERRIAAAEEDILLNANHIAANRRDLDAIMAFPEINITGMPPFYLLRRGDFSALSNRAYDPVFFSDFPVDASSVLWLHPGEERVKQMIPQILKDPHIKPSVDRLIQEANQGTTGNKIEIGSYVGVYYFFAADPATWTPAATYTRKETMTMVSIVPAKWGGGLYKPALLFEVVSGHLDGGGAAGDFTGMYCLMDKSETSTPDYHWYRYGDSVNINGMAMADVKVQYH